MEREKFGSRLGFILVSAGCAIGIGNVWKFPYVTGQNGGGIFVLFYLLFLVIMGVPVLTMELAVGRASGLGSVGGFKKLEPEGAKWHLHGIVCLAGCVLLMMYYTTVSGWMLNYAVRFATGYFKGYASENVSDAFGEMLSSPAQMLIFMAVTVIIGIAVCIIGLQSGIEKVSKVMMIGLLLLMIVLSFHSLTLDNAVEGVKFYLLPSFERARSVGFGHVITAAMNQSFFTLSLGIGAMEIFGSYMSREHTLSGEAFRICILDTFVALMSGLIIFPACFSFGIETDAGPSLIFVTLPRVFINMSGGRIWGTLFFVFMTFASLSTVIAVFENIIAGGMDNFGLSRKHSSIVSFFALLILSIPCALGYNIWNKVRLIGAQDILDSEDFIVSNLLLPAGSLVFLLFCVTKWGWGFDGYIKEANQGDGIRLPIWLKNYFRFVLPVLIIVILIQGLTG